MKVVVQGQGEVSLTQREFLAAGGEGSVYVKGLTAFKVYADPAKMVPIGKISELATITDPNVIRPDRVLLDPKSSTPVGFTMRFVPDTLPLCTIFTRAYREREGLSPADMLRLVQALQGLVTHVHDGGALIVDLNEMNFLVDRAHRAVYGIDVDSYQTRSYHATALMPSVRDWKVQGHDFTEGSDWFSFACVAFQLFVGIHPYKGKHPTVSGLDERMRLGVSVFDPVVSVPKVVYPFTSIPPAYLSWFERVLQGGERVAPPTDAFAAAARVAVRSIASGDTLDIAEIASFPEDIRGYTENAGTMVVWTRNAIYVAGRATPWTARLRGVGFSPRMNHAVLAWTEGTSLRLYNATTNESIPCTVTADEVMSTGGRIYVRAGERVLEVLLNDVGQGVVASTRVAANVVEHASHLYEGVLVQSLLGSTFVSMFPRAGIAYQTRVPELDVYRIVDARHAGRVLMVVGARGGSYDRVTLRFSEDYATYTVATTKDITPSGLNFVVLESDVCVHLTEEEQLELSAHGSTKVKVVKSASLGNDMGLVRHGGRVAFVRGDKLFSMKLR